MLTAIKGTLVADNHTLCRAGLAAMFTHALSMTTVQEAGSFPDVLACIGREATIGLVTIDLDLPGMRGSECLRQLRTQYPSLLVVVVAATRDRNLVLDSLCAGVHGYVPKDLPADEMVSAFRNVLSGQIYVPPLVSDVSVKRAPADASRSLGPEACLTGRQHEVLDLLAAGRSNKEIARALRIAEGTVKVHITAAFRLLGVHNRVSAAAALQTRQTHAGMAEDFLPGLLHPERRGQGLNVHGSAFPALAGH